MTNECKYKKVLYNLVYKTSLQNNCSEWMRSIKQTLDECGLSYVWLEQGEHVNYEQLKLKTKSVLLDQYVQLWNNTTQTSTKCSNYRIYKEDLVFENYLTTMPVPLRNAFTKFRCRNTKLPVETRTFAVHENDDKCKICTLNVTGDEFHYLFECPFFANERSLYLRKYYVTRPSSLKMQQLFQVKENQLLKLCKFVRIIHEHFCNK